VNDGAQYDVIVSGAGLAGSAAAIWFGRAGLRVALLERSPDPDHYKRICTHEIQASAVPLVEELGLSDALTEIGTPRRRVAAYVHPFGWIRPEHAPGEADARSNYNVRREKIDPMVRRVAAETPGVDLMLDRRVTGLVRERGRVTGAVARSRSGATTEIRAGLVVGADGRESTVARASERRERRFPNGRFVFWSYFDGVELPFAPEAQTWLLDPDVAYALPTDGGLTLLSTMLSSPRLPEYREDAEGLWRRVWSSLPDGPSLDGVRREGPFLARLDMTLHKRRPAGGGLALVGDAALNTDPMWGWGCGWALETAKALAERTAEALRSGRGLPAALLRYRLWHQARFWSFQSFAAHYAHGRPFTPVQRAVFKAATLDNTAALRLHSFETAYTGFSAIGSPRAMLHTARVCLADALGSAAPATGGSDGLSGRRGPLPPGAPSPADRQADNRVLSS
jgi:2-polyprenyl-6-methoxyphenol hydroxylase-like FAD-dependent oxidoreductase